MRAAAGYRTVMTGIDMNSPEQRSGRLLMTSWFGSWLTAAGLETIAEGDWWGLAFVTPGLILAAVAIPMLRSEARRGDSGWVRRDSYATVALAMGVVGVLARGLVMTDSPTERDLVLAAVPVWILLTLAFVVLRLAAIREAGRRQNVSRES